LLPLQFKDKPILIDKKIKPFISKLAKIIKQKEKNYKLEVFSEYRKMSQDELSEIELSLFSTNKKELYIKEFLAYQNDETLGLNEDDFSRLIKESIEYPGLVEMFKKNLENKSILKKTKGIATIKEYKSWLNKGIDLKEYGFRLNRVRWKMNPVLKELLEKKLSFS
jgi:hypothetical protein